MGRPLIGERAMTPAERQRRRWAKRVRIAARQKELLAKKEARKQESIQQRHQARADYEARAEKGNTVADLITRGIRLSRPSHLLRSTMGVQSL